MTRRRLPLIALVVAVLVAVVALVAHGRPLAGTGGQAGGLPLAFWDYVLTSAVILVVLFWLALLVSAFFVPGGGPARFPRPSWVGMLRQFVGIMAVALIVLLFRQLHPTEKPQHIRGHIHTPGGQGPSGSATTVHLRWEEVAVVAGLLLVAAVVAVARRNRDRLPPLPSLAAPEAVAAALDESLDDLRADPDLRRAIIAAYARMERALAAAGVPRWPSEAPLEYVERALLGLHTSAPGVRRLTDLFEWAKFSHHEPDSAMRDDAVDALAAVRDELRAEAFVAA